MRRGRLVGKYPLTVSYHEPMGVCQREKCASIPLWFAKTLADFEINDTAALPLLSGITPSHVLIDRPYASERSFAYFARVGACYSRIRRYANNSPSRSWNPRIATLIPQLFGDHSR